MRTLAINLRHILGSVLAAIICSGVFVAASQAQTFTVLHNFTNESGGWVPTSLAMDAGGNLYGNNFEGGP